MSKRSVCTCVVVAGGVFFISAGGFGGIRAALPQAIQLGKSNSRVLNGANARPNVALHGARANVFATARSELQKHAGKNARFSLPMTFEPNTGQFDSSIRFVGRGAGMVVWVTRNGIYLRLPDGVSGGKLSPNVLRLSVERIEKGQRENAAVSHFIWRAEDRLRATSNYFFGRDPGKWHTGVPHFARAIGATESGAGISMAVYGNRDGLEYDLRLAPGFDASKLRLKFSGTRKIQITNGDAILFVGHRQVRMAKPRMYEELPDGLHKMIACAYVTETDRSVGIEAGPHDSEAALVVDPSLSVTYSTFLGGAGAETAGNIAVDSSGKVYVAGVADNPSSFPESSASFLSPVEGTSAFYIAKIDPTVTGPNSLLYLDFLGGSGTQSGGVIAVDQAGDAAITGTTTSVDFPVTGSSEPTSGLTSGNGNDAVISEINAAGYALNFSAYFGGSGRESQAGPGGIAMDNVGNAYIASDTEPVAPDVSSPNLPVTPNAFQTTWDGFGSDGFLAVFAPPSQAGGAPNLIYCTYLGTNSSGQVGIGGIGVDLNGNAYIGGTTTNASGGFPATAAFQSTYGGGNSDGFVMQIAPEGLGPNDLVYATLIGGNGADEVLGIALDPPSSLPAGIPPSVYVTGQTQSTDFPTKNAYQSALHGSICGSDCPAITNAFLAVIAQDPSSHATSLSYATYLGGSDTDQGLSIAVAAPGGVYVAGQTNSPDFPWRDNLQTFNGTADAFIAEFDSTASGDASLIYSTPLGGSSPPGAAVSAAATGIAVGGPGEVYVTGETSGVITTAGAVNGFQASCTSCGLAPANADAFVVSISEDDSAREPSVYFNVVSENCGTQNIGSLTSCPPVAALNGGDAPLDISDVEIVPNLGSNPADFVLQGQGPCIGATIPPGACAFDVNFTASAGGPETAFVAVTDNAPGSPQLLELKGTGEAPHALIAPQNLNFGSQTVGVSNPNSETITITNSGTEALTLSRENGPSTASFSLQGGTCQFASATLAANTSCYLEIAFNPKATGSLSDEIDIWDNSDLQSSAEQKVTLTGTGVAPAPQAEIQPSSMSLNFGSVSTGTASAPQAVTLTDSGTAALAVSSVSIAGSNAADFEINANGTTCPLTGGTIAAQAQCTVAVQFSPQSVATSKAATLSFSDNAVGSPQSVALAGSATPAPVLQVSPAALEFSLQMPGAASAAQTVTAINAANASIDISSVTIGGSNAADFEINANGTTCPLTGGTIAAQAQCTVAVQFAPQSSGGSKTAVLTFASASGNPQTVALDGSTVSLQVAPGALDFGSQTEGIASAAQSITVSNTASSSASISGITITGSSDFVEQNACPVVLSAGQQCQISVTFDPAEGAAPGARAASLSVSGAAPSSVSLSATATQAEISIPDGMNFVGQLVGNAGAPQPIAIANSSTGSLAGGLRFTGVSVTGIDRSDFAISANTCLGAGSALLSPGNSCAVQIAFQPQAAPTCGANPNRTASLELQDNAPGSPQMIPLSGAAEDFCLSSPNGQPASTPIDPGQTASYSLEIAGTGGFTGAVSLSCSLPAGVALGPCATNPSSVQVSPGSPSQFNVTVATLAPASSLAPFVLPPVDRSGRLEIAISGCAVCLFVVFITAVWKRGSAPRVLSKAVSLIQIAALATGLSIGIAGCGSAGNSDATNTVTSLGTPPGTYSITLTAAYVGSNGNTVNRTASLSLTVD